MHHLLKQAFSIDDAFLKRGYYLVIMSYIATGAKGPVAMCKQLLVKSLFN